MLVQAHFEKLHSENILCGYLRFCVKLQFLGAIAITRVSKEDRQMSRAPDCGQLDSLNNGDKP